MFEIECVAVFALFFIVNSAWLDDGSRLIVGYKSNSNEGWNYSLKNTHSYKLNKHYLASADSVYLECKRAVTNTTHELYALGWQDNYGYSSISNYLTTTIRLILDKDESYINISCVDSSTPKVFNINIILGGYKKSDFSNHFIMYHQLGGHITVPSWCSQGIVRYPNGSRYGIKSTATIIDYFTERDNGTLLLCVSYNKINITSKIYERRITYKVSFLIKEPSKNDNSTLYIIISFVAGVAFAVVGMILVRHIIKKHQSRNVPAPVVYSDLVTHRNTDQKPRVEETPYANIIGVMKPVILEEDHEEDLYYTTPFQ